LRRSGAFNIPISGMSGESWSRLVGSPQWQRLANLAVRDGSGCPREGFKKARK